MMSLIKVMDGVVAKKSDTAYWTEIIEWIGKYDRVIDNFLSVKFAYGIMLGTNNVSFFDKQVQHHGRLHPKNQSRATLGALSTTGQHATICAEGWDHSSYGFEFRKWLVVNITFSIRLSSQLCCCELVSWFVVLWDCAEFKLQIEPCCSNSQRLIARLTTRLSSLTRRHHKMILPWNNIVECMETKKKLHY